MVEGGSRLCIVISWRRNKINFKSFKNMYISIYLLVQQKEKKITVLSAFGHNETFIFLFRILLFFTLIEHCQSKRTLAYLSYSGQIIFVYRYRDVAINSQFFLTTFKRTMLFEGNISSPALELPKPSSSFPQLIATKTAKPAS